MKLRWLLRSRTDIRNIHTHIASQNPLAANQVRHRIGQSVWLIKQFPQSGRIGAQKGTRELIVPGLPYIIVYRIAKDHIQILRVFHMAQDQPRFH